MIFTLKDINSLIICSDFFISFLTDKGDLVYDPFGGSCVTGKSSEDKQREWICSEINEEYLKGAKSRFID